MSIDELEGTGPSILEAVLVTGTKRSASRLSGRVALFDAQGNPIDLAAGSQGPKGDTGPIGPIGPTGPAGAQGASGAQGSAGVAGPKGDVGVQGPQGPQGLKGDKGDKGDTGVGQQGPQGLAGSTGATGPTGPAGAGGPKGDTGAQGAQGVKGDTGNTGVQGPQGLQGAKGDIGLSGPTGSQGPAGITGPKGDTGVQGAQGPKGDTGATGVGTTGAQGPQGIQGNTGPAGPTGPQGPAGPEGPTTVVNLPILGFQKKVGTGTAPGYKDNVTANMDPVDDGAGGAMSIAYTAPMTGNGAWWEVTAVMGGISKMDAAYHYALLGLYVNPPDADSIAGIEAFFTQHSTVDQWGFRTLTALFKLSPGVAYTARMVLNFSGGTWKYYTVSSRLTLHGKAFGR